MIEIRTENGEHRDINPGSSITGMALETVRITIDASDYDQRFRDWLLCDVFTRIAAGGRVHMDIRW